MGRSGKFAVVLGVMGFLASAAGIPTTKAEAAAAENAPVEKPAPAANNPAPAGQVPNGPPAVNPVPGVPQCCKELEHKIQAQADEIAGLQRQLRAIEALLNGDGAPARPGLVATVKQQGVNIAKNTNGLSHHAAAIENLKTCCTETTGNVQAQTNRLDSLDILTQNHSNSLTFLRRILGDHARWLEAISIPRNSADLSPENRAPDIFGRMLTPDPGEAPGPADAAQNEEPQRRYLEHIQRATHGKLKINNTTGRDQPLIINGVAWIASRGNTYVWVPVGPLTIARRGGEVPQEFGLPGSEQNRRWFFDNEQQRFYVVYDIN